MSRPVPYFADLPATRVGSLLRYTGLMQAAGAPVERLLECAGIPPALLDHPAAIVPLERAYRFGELACDALGTEHLGLCVGQTASLDGLGAYGRMLQNALTLHDYLHKGIALYGMLNTGQQLWLSEHGDGLRFNIATPGAAGVGAYQSHLEVLVVTLAKCRQAIGPSWTPARITLAYRSREALPVLDLFAGAQIDRGSRRTWFTLPWDALGRRLPGDASAPWPDESQSPADAVLPQTMDGLVQCQIESLLDGSAVHVGEVAESLGMSRRTLQRGLGTQGLSFAELLMRTRIRRAATWLQDSDKPIVEIAFDPGYSDASNFTRAFRRQTGVPPETFRAQSRAT